MAKANYVPYKGGQGPSQDQIEGNDRALLKAMKELGIKCSYKNHSHGHMDPFKQIHFRSSTTPHHQEITVSYDRWGFVFDYDLEEPEIDQDMDEQFGLERAIEIIKEVAQRS